MPSFLLLVICVALAGCSKALRIEVLNASDSPLEICSQVENATECTKIAPRQSGLVKWGVGVFKLSSETCTAEYRLRLPDEMEDYAQMKDNAIKARMEPDWRLFVIPQAESLEAGGRVQPAGYPAAPVKALRGCSARQA